ncbi:hypothetical protein B6I99_28675, partial [Klebsiella quasipneumoniae]|uniref:hypothetical protein n=1 Tax=Klebsiella quasipneumoniae TaxID=1463165 RepID=UPI000CC3EEF8
TVFIYSKFIERSDQYRFLLSIRNTEEETSHLLVPLMLVSLSDYVVYVPAMNYLFSKPATEKWIQDVTDGLADCRFYAGHFSLRLFHMVHFEQNTLLNIS